jgi:hypothetical protein
MKRKTGSIRGFVGGLGVALGLATFAAPVTIPNVFTAGTPARAADVNANFSAVATAHNETDARVIALDGELDAHLSAATTAHNDTVARVTALEATLREPNLRPSGNLVLGASNPSSGNILKGVLPFIHDYGEYNVFVGVSSGNFTTTAIANTALGHSTLAAVTSGTSNTAVGAQSLNRNTTGSNNTALGMAALTNNTAGGMNTAIGRSALYNNTSGASNVGIGISALYATTTGSQNTAVGIASTTALTDGSNNTALGGGSLATLVAGSSNVALGSSAGIDLQNGSGNVYLGHRGSATESQTLRIGAAQTRAFIAGIRGRNTGSSNTVPVVIDENGQLGTVASSRRFKENIVDMGDASSLLMRLRPVTFQYRDDRNPAGPAVQYGLIAEEVASVAPGLVVHAADGEVESVFYEFLPPMLLNELQKQQRSLNAQKARVAELENKVAVLARQAQRTAALLARLDSTQAAE